MVKLDGLANVPPTLEDHVALDAAPPIEPFKLRDWPAQSPFG